jgi:oligopeptide/dipeptide ABC transporter ATP-binding protein
MNTAESVQAQNLPAGLRGNLDNELLRVERLEKTFALRGSAFGGGAPLRAVDDVSFDVARGETLGLVGESGCGKSTIARCVMRLLELTGGRVLFDGIDVGAASRQQLREIRRRMQIVFQDPFASLDPRMSASAIVEEPLQVHQRGTRPERAARSHEMLRMVGIAPTQVHRKPNAFSGGQRQRIAIARALVLEPELIILDEPVTALDVSIQAQVLNLLSDLQESLQLTYLFIVHDLTVAEYFCHRIAVLYLGSVVELAERDAVFYSPLHPYTVALLSAVPVPDPAIEQRRNRIVLKGEVPALGQVEPGCRFRHRCPVGHDRQICRDEPPPLQERAPDHWVACHFPGELQITTTAKNSGRP